MAAVADNEHWSADTMLKLKLMLMGYNMDQQTLLLPLLPPLAGQ